MSQESLPIPPTGEQNSLPLGSRVKVENGQPASIVTDTSEDEVRTQIAHGKDPNITAVHYHPTERDVRRLLNEITSAHHGAIPKDRQNEIADRLRNPQE